MDGWTPFYVVAAVVFAVYVLLAVFESRGRGDHSPTRLRALQRHITQRLRRWH